jgi:hypothetical protein
MIRLVTSRSSRVLLLVLALVLAIAGVGAVFFGRVAFLRMPQEVLLDGTVPGQYRNLYRNLAVAALAHATHAPIRVLRFAGKESEVLADGLLTTPLARDTAASQILASEPYPVDIVKGSPLTAQASQAAKRLASMHGGLLSFLSDGVEDVAPGVLLAFKVQPKSLAGVHVLTTAPASSTVVTTLQTAGATVTIIRSVGDLQAAIATLRGDTTLKRLCRASWRGLFVLAGIAVLLAALSAGLDRVQQRRAARAAEAEARRRRAAQPAPKPAFDASVYLQAQPALVKVTDGKLYTCIKRLAPGDPQSAMLIASQSALPADIVLSPSLVPSGKTLLVRLTLDAEGRDVCTNYGPAVMAVKTADGGSRKLRQNEHVTGALAKLLISADFQMTISHPEQEVA